MSELWAATASGLHRIQGEPAHKLVGRDVGAIGVTGWGRWAIADGRSILSTHSGDWEEEATLASSPRSTDLTARCLLADSRSGDVLVGTSEAHLFLLAGGTLLGLEGFDDAPGRGDWYTPWGGPPDVRSISRSDDLTDYVNIHVGGILRLRDGAAAWEPTIDIDADVHQVLAHDGLVLAACARGLAVSRDHGDSWEFLTQGLHAPYCRAVAVSGEHILLGASTGHDSKQAALYRMPIGGSAFEKCGNGLPERFDANLDTFWVAADGAEAGLATPDGRVFISNDEGASWVQAADGLPHIRAVTFL